MYALDENITFTFNIEPVADPANIPAAISLSLVDPTGINTYDVDGLTIGAVYVAPTDQLAGSYTFTTSFATAGTWSIILGDGVADNYVILATNQILIESSDPTYITDININPLV